MMRFRGGGVGHKSTRAATDFFKNDRDPLDLKVSDSDLDEEEIAVEEIEGDANPGSDEENDYGYNLREIPDFESDQDEDPEFEEEEEDYGAEDDGGGIDEDIVALGYSEL